MATVKCDFRCDLTKPIKVEYLDGNIFTMDNGGNTINVYCYEGEEPATLGGSVSANVIRPDGTTVPVSGAIDGNKAYVTLQQAAYAVPGHVTIIIKVTQDTTVTTIAAIVANNMLSSTDTIVDPGTIIPSVQALIAQIETAVGSIPADYSALLATLAADYSSSKTYAVGDYAWQAGVLKRCIVPITTAETYTAAHWTNAVLGDDLSALKSAFNAITSGTKNLFNAKWLLEASGWTEQNGEYSGIAKDLIDTFKRTVQPFPFENFEQNTQYTFSCYAKVSGSTNTSQCFRFLITYTDDSTSTVLGVDNSASTYTKFIGTSESGKTIRKVNASYGDGQTNTLYLKQVQCEKGIVATDYVKFTTAEDLVAREDISNMKTVLFDISKELNGETLTADSAVNSSYIDTSGQIHSGYNDYAIYYYTVSDKSFVNVAGAIKGYSVAVVSVWDSTKTTMKRIAYTSTQNTSPLAYDVYVEVDTDEVLAVTQYVSSLADAIIPGTFDVDVEKLETEIEELNNFNQPNFIPPNGSQSGITQTTPDFTTLTGKTWNAVGDSITAGDYYRSGVGTRLGVTVANKGVASCTIAINNTYLQSQSIVERVCGLNGNTAIPDADIWTIMGGLNDVLYDSPIGDIESTDNATVYGALKAICTNIRSRSNNPKLILMTPTQSNRDNKKMRDIVKAIKEVAKLYACPVIDTYNESGICHTNLANVLADSVHPNSIGSAMLVSAIASGIQRNC